MLFTTDVAAKAVLQKAQVQFPNEQAKGDSIREKLPQSNSRKPGEEPGLKGGTCPHLIDTEQQDRGYNFTAILFCKFSTIILTHCRKVCKHVGLSLQYYAHYDAQ